MDRACFVVDPVHRAVLQIERETGGMGQSRRGKVFNIRSIQVAPSDHTSPFAQPIELAARRIEGQITRIAKSNG